MGHTQDQEARVSRGLGKPVIFSLAVLAGTLAGSPVAQPHARAGRQASAAAQSSGEAAAILSAVREALGGEKRISSVKTLAATGRTRQVQGENLVPIEFEILIELPDKYVRTDEIPARESGPNSRGFNGDALIQIGDPPGGGRGRGGPPPGAGSAPSGPPAGGAPQGRGDRGRGPGGAPPNPTLPVKQDFARLTLGMFASSFSSFPLTFGYAGQAEAPEGKANVIEVKGPGDFAGRLFIDAKTNLPLMFSWNTPPNLVPVTPGAKPPENMPPGSVTFDAPAPPGASATPEQRTQFEQEVLAAREKAMKSARPTENRIYYADYRDVNGHMFPFRIRRAVGATTIEETTFDRFRINARVDPRKFEVRK
jgi:hypothetical protein